MPDESVFADLLALRRVGPGTFETGRHTAREVPRLFGGQLLAQALWAAGRAFDPCDHVASLRGLFLRPAKHLDPLGYDVSVVKAGRSLVHRRVVATQSGSDVFVLDVIFDRSSDASSSVPVVGMARDTTPAHAHPDPAFAGSPLASFSYTDCFELRFAHVPSSGIRHQPFHPFWVRGIRLGDIVGDTLGRACALAFVSDMGSLSGTVPQAEDLDPFGGSSLEHAMWFGPSPDLTRWHCVDLAPVLREGRRGLAHGTVADESGRRVAVVTQLAYF